MFPAELLGLVRDIYYRLRLDKLLYFNESKKYMIEKAHNRYVYSNDIHFYPFKLS